MDNRNAVDTNWPTGFMVVQGNQLETLRDVMVGWFKRYPLGPLEQEQLLVQSNGIAQWLKLALAQAPEQGGCGVAASIAADLPGRFVWRTYRSFLPNLATTSPYDKGPLTWRLFRILGQLERLNSPEILAPLKGFIDAGNDAPQRRYQLAGRLAELYDQYQVYRADWLLAWSAGRDCLQTNDGDEVALESEQRWQPLLWRALSDDIEADPNLPTGPMDRHSRAQIHQAFLDTCADQVHPPADLPRRVVVFGISSMPQQTLQVFQAIARYTQVLLFTMNPCQYFWGDLIEGGAWLKREYKRAQRRPERSQIPLLSSEQLHQYGQSLLAAWGKQGRDFLHLLDEQDQPDSYRQCFADQKIDLFQSPGDQTLLQQLQQDILELRPLHEAKQLARTIDVEADHSLRFMEAHSPQREIEILHDQLLEAFQSANAKGEPLEPRDILVMVPDINRYTRHIEAVFGRYKPVGEDARDPRFLPFHIADQGQRYRNPLIIAFEHLLRLPQARFEATELLDLLDVPAVRARFDLQEADIPRLKKWVEGANIRWGLNAEQRATLDLPPDREQNSWLFGIRRMLLGYATGPGDAWNDIQPYDEIGGLDAELLGPLVLMLEKLEHSWHVLQRAHTPQDWASLLQEELQAYFTAQSEGDARVLSALGFQLDSWLQVTVSAGLEDESIPLDVVRDALLSSLDQPTLSQRFLSGAINFATLMPMRAIPFRHIWMLGMNDGDYPRSVPRTDFDLMAGHYRPGDRSRREDDRYLFLEALLSARERLVISWHGRHIRDNSERPPSVLVGQLRDYIGQAWPQPDLLQALTTAYPMQPFSHRYFTEPTESTEKPLFTYASEWEAVHDDAKQVSHEDLSQQRLPDWKPEGALTLRQLRDFLRSPVNALFTQRLRVASAEDLADTPVIESFEHDALQSWALKDRLMTRSFTRGLKPEELAERFDEEQARLVREGVLIEGALGQIQTHELTGELTDLYATWNRAFEGRSLMSDQPLSLHLDLQLNSGSVLEFSAELPPLLQSDKDANTYCQVNLQASNLKKDAKWRWRNMIPGWLDHLAATLALDQQGVLPAEVTTHVLSPVGELTFLPMSPGDALAYVNELVECWFEGMHCPLPLSLNAGMRWVSQATDDQVNNSFVEDDLRNDERLARIFPNIEALRADGRFSELAERLYKPIVDHIQE